MAYSSKTQGRGRLYLLVMVKRFVEKLGIKLEELKTLFSPSFLHSGLLSQERKMNWLEYKK